ncbi:hypothetical protein GGX14DRAFT_569944 [Mycena pura]|uniref:Hydrophobin n=1 Tax=Mycena pura TaxID=153505 RepID=A0AAD6V6F4_9AGAR|nr:hypothetical protein GGX14DRAFT_569944 [Mycena pura]
MFSKLLACVVVTLSALAAAVPAPPTATEALPGPVSAGKAVNSADLVPGVDGVGEILLCVNAGFGAPCVNALYLENTCTNVPTNFQDNVSAVQPPQGVVCTLYQNLDCGGQNIISIYPGYPNLFDQGFNDRLTAWICS